MGGEVDVRLVEDDDAHVAHEQPGERDELLLPRGQRGPTRTEERVETVRQPGDPVDEPELDDGRLDVAARGVVEEGDVVGEGAGDDLGALGDRGR